MKGKSKKVPGSVESTLKKGKTSREIVRKLTNPANETQSSLSYKMSKVGQKYAPGGKDISALSPEEQRLLVKEDLLSGKDRMISKLPNFIQKNFAGKAMNRIKNANQEWDLAASQIPGGLGSAPGKYESAADQGNDENKVMRQIIKNRAVPSEQAPSAQTSTFAETPKQNESLLNTNTGGPRLFEEKGDLPRVTGLTPTANYGNMPATSQSKPAGTLKKPMTADMQRVAKLQQKMKAAGLDVKVDGSWGKETQRAYESFTKGKADDKSRRGTVNTGKGPTRENAQNLKEARALGAKGPVLDQVNVTAPARKTGSSFDSPVLRQAAADTQARMKREQQAAPVQSSNTLSSPSAFTSRDKGKGQDFTAVQNSFNIESKRDMPMGSRSSTEASSDNTRVSQNQQPALSKGFNAARWAQGTETPENKKQYFSAKQKNGNASVKSRSLGDIVSEVEGKYADGGESLLSKFTGGNLTSKAVKKQQPPLGKQMQSAGSSIGRTGYLVPTGKQTTFTNDQQRTDAMKRMGMIGNSGAATKPMYESGVKKVYNKIDTKLGGILPGGVTRADAKMSKFVKQAEDANKQNKRKEELETSFNSPSAPKNDASFMQAIGQAPTITSKEDNPNFVGPKNQSTEKNPILFEKETPAKKSLKAQYEENKGGYARALKGGKKDAQGNIVDPNTGLAYKKLTSQGGGGSVKKPAEKEGPKTANFNSSGTANKNVSIKGVTYFTNNRAVDEKTGRKGSYDARKGSIVWDKPAVKKRKGDDTYMDEGIDIASRAIGSIGAGALGGFLTGGVGTAPSAVAGDWVGKKVGNWLNKKLGYREEDDKSQEDYSVGEGLMAGVGGGLLSKAVKPVGGALARVGGRILSKEGAKLAASPLGRAASKAIGLVRKTKPGAQAPASVAPAATAASNTASTAANAARSTVNAPSSVSRLVPTAQSSLSVGKVSAAPIKAAGRHSVRGAGGKFQQASGSLKRVNSTPGSTKMTAQVPNRFNPDNAIIRPNGPTAMDKLNKVAPKPSTAAAESATESAKSSLKQKIADKSKAALSKTKEAGRKTLESLKNNKKKAIAAGVVGAGGAGYYAAKD